MNVIPAAALRASAVASKKRRGAAALTFCLEHGKVGWMLDTAHARRATPGHSLIMMPARSKYQATSMMKTTLAAANSGTCAAPRAQCAEVSQASWRRRTSFSSEPPTRRKKCCTSRLKLMSSEQWWWSVPPRQKESSRSPITSEMMYRPSEFWPRWRSVPPRHLHRRGSSIRA